MLKFVVTCITSFLLLSAVAHAANAPSQTVYGGQSQSVKSAVAKSPSTPAQAGDETGTLPFTGVDLGIGVLAGGVLIAAGLGLRRLDSRRRN